VTLTRRELAALALAAPTAPLAGCGDDGWYDVAATKRFICPCHGAVFDDRGRKQGGPGNGPLERWPARPADGRVEVKPRRS
jgi:Rieske Fe-S protein